MHVPGHHREEQRRDEPPAAPKAMRPSRPTPMTVATPNRADVSRMLNSPSPKISTGSIAA
jgi:hypothetical protein